METIIIIEAFVCRTPFISEVSLLREGFNVLQLLGQEDEAIDDDDEL